MSVYRSYFQKNNTLIKNNELNVSQNPVGEVSYGTSEKNVSRVIFKLDLDSLADKITNEQIPLSAIQSHKLVLVNTIAQREDLIGGYSYTRSIERASSFQLDLFEIVEDWDEGSGYEFHYNDGGYFKLPKGANNWFEKKTGINWYNEGAYFTGSTGVTGVSVSRIIGSQYFEKGNEDIEIDVTNYINEVLFTGTTHHGLGLKHTNALEKTETLKRRAVAFHLKTTPTFFEPYVETVIADQISDDRNYFYMDKDNDLFLYSNRGDVTVSAVTIYDYEGNVHLTIPASGVTRVKTGIYKISVNIDSTDYPDNVLFKDVWTITQDSKVKNISNEFYLVNSENFYSFGLSNRLNPDNYHFSFFGLKSGENLQRGDKKRIEINIKQLYKSQDNNLPLSLEYRLFIKQTGDVEIDVIPYTKVDRTVQGYEFILDTSWLIPQDYYLDLKISDGTVFNRKSPMKFTIVSDEAFT